MLQKWFCNLHCIWQKTLWTLINCTLWFVTLDNARKNTPKAFIYWKICVFFKNFCFQHPLRCYKSDLLTSTAIVRIPCRPLEYVPCALTHSILRKNKGQIFLYTGKLASFFENLCFPHPLRCYRSDLLTSTEIVSQSSFFTGNFALLSKNCFFNNLLGVSEMIFKLRQQLSKNIVDPFEMCPVVFHTR